jgi:hypothetical protein
MYPLTKREHRFLIIFVLLFAILGYRIYRIWSEPATKDTKSLWTASITKETEHYIISSSATPRQTEEIADVAEIVYAGYKDFIGQLKKEISPHPKLQMKLYKDREEFRRCNRITNWYEAYYSYPYCYQYYSSNEKNPHHWAMHEAAHQLNNEAAHLTLPQWLDEGIACYIATSKIADKSLHPGDVDKNTYPIWWLKIIATTGDIQTDKENKSITPLRAIVSGQNGPDLNTYFNLYYLHWWSLTHFLMNYGNGQYRDELSKLISENGTLSSFESNIGNIETIERQWYQYLRELKAKLQ